MISEKIFRSITEGFPEVTVIPHFEKLAFRTPKRIFASLSADKKQASLKLSLIDQSVFCSIDKTIIYPVSNKWGKQGWTIVELSKVSKPLLVDALNHAYKQGL